MSSSMASSLLLRRTLRLPISSPNLCRHSRALSYSSLACSPFTRSRRAIVPQSLKKPSSLLSLRSASAKAGRADENLKRVLEQEILCAKQELNQDIPLPNRFPFEIIDNPGDQTITLKREFGVESIQATVFMNLEEANMGNEEDNSGDDKNDDSVQPSLSLVVMIDKGQGPTVEFCCSLNADELSIESMAMKKRDDPDDQGAYQGPDFFDLDENLQKTLHEYLEARGIHGSLFDFLREYMIIKEGKEYLRWLQNMKKFLEK